VDFAYTLSDYKIKENQFYGAKIIDHVHADQISQRIQESFGRESILVNFDLQYPIDC